MTALAAFRVTGRARSQAVGVGSLLEQASHCSYNTTQSGPKTRIELPNHFLSLVSCQMSFCAQVPSRSRSCWGEIRCFSVHLVWPGRWTWRPDGDPLQVHRPTRGLLRPVYHDGGFELVYCVGWVDFQSSSPCGV